MPNSPDSTMSAAQAARNLAHQQRRLLLKPSASVGEDPSPSLRKTSVRLEQPLAPDYEADNSMLVLNPLDVAFYDGNPRVDLGEDYPQLKASIRRQGLNTKLSVTRRPGAAHYMVEAGGNRRLRILKELIEEGEQRFHSEIFVFRAWKSEATVLLRHLSENLQRANMTLYEEAAGVLRLKRELETESGASYSMRRLEEVLGDIGFPVTKSALSIYAFTVERLSPLGPATRALTVKATRDILQSGLNRLAKLAGLFGVEEQMLYDECLNPVLEAAGRRYAETGAFDHEALYGDCEDALTHRLQTTRRELQRWLVVLKANPKAGREELTTQASLVSAKRVAGCDAPTPITPSPDVNLPDSDSSPSAPPGPPSTPAASVLSLSGTSSDSPPDDEVTTSPSRLEAALHAFATDVGAEPYLRRHTELPLGFYVEVPRFVAPPVQSEANEAPDDPARLPLDLQRSLGHGNPYLYHGWWLLMQISGLLADGDGADLDDATLRALPAESAWRRAAERGFDEIERLFSNTAGPRPDFAFVLEWLTSPGHPLTGSLTTLLASLREARRDHHAR